MLYLLDMFYKIIYAFTFAENFSILHQDNHFENIVITKNSKVESGLTEYDPVIIDWEEAEYFGHKIENVHIDQPNPQTKQNNEQYEFNNLFEKGFIGYLMLYITRECFKLYNFQLNMSSPSINSLVGPISKLILFDNVGAIEEFITGKIDQETYDRVYSEQKLETNNPHNKTKFEEIRQILMNILNSNYNEFNDSLYPKKSPEIKDEANSEFVIDTACNNGNTSLIQDENMKNICNGALIKKNKLWDVTNTEVAVQSFIDFQPFDDTEMPKRDYASWKVNQLLTMDSEKKLIKASNQSLLPQHYQVANLKNLNKGISLDYFRKPRFLI